jgi:hypothetical protein
MVSSVFIGATLSRYGELLLAIASANVEGDSNKSANMLNAT